MNKNLDVYLNQLRQRGYRITKCRVALLDVLSDDHLTFKQIQVRLAEKGFTNVASIYNNLDFFLREKIIVMLYINQVKYYELAVENHMHTADNHIHLMDQENNKIIELNNQKVYDVIKKAVESELPEYQVDYIKVTVGIHERD